MEDDFAPITHYEQGPPQGRPDVNAGYTDPLFYAALDYQSRLSCALGFKEHTEYKWLPAATKTTNDGR